MKGKTLEYVLETYMYMYVCPMPQNNSQKVSSNMRQYNGLMDVAAIGMTRL